MHCPKCSSTSLYGRDKVERYFTLDENNYIDDIFSSETITKLTSFECYTCGNKWRSKL